MHTPETSAPPPRRSILTKKRVIAALVALSGIVVILAAIVIFNRDAILNEYVRPRLEQGVADSHDGRLLTLSDLHYQIWRNCIVCDSGSMSVRDSSTKILYDLRIKGIRYSFWGNHMECNSVSYTASDSSSSCDIDTVFIDGFAPRRLITGEGIRAVLFAEMRIQLIGMVMRQPKQNSSLRCERMWISPVDSQLSADHLTESDSSRECSMGAVTLRGIDWTKLFGSDPLIPTLCATSVMDASDIVILYPGSQYEFQCVRAHVSFPASKLSADSVSIHPVDGDATFFADSKFRKTRIAFLASHCSMDDADLCGLLTGASYGGRLVMFHDPQIAILVNKEKPVNTREPKPRMVDEILASYTTTRIRFDSVKIERGMVLYQERFVGGARPAEVTLDSLEVAIHGFGNSRIPPDTARIKVDGLLQGAQFHAKISLPLSGAGLSAHCTGSMRHSELSSLNSWVEIEDAMRVKSGKLQEATFDLMVSRGKSTGNVRLVYRDFKVALINAETKSDGGIFNRIASFVANTFKLRSDNVPDKAGILKIGSIRHTHDRDEPFFQFLWFSLRSGLKDVIGF